MQERRRKKIKFASLELGHVHAQIDFNAGLRVALAEEPEQVRLGDVGPDGDGLGGGTGVPAACELLHGGPQHRFPALLRCLPGARNHHEA